MRAVGRAMLSRSVLAVGVLVLVGGAAAAKAGLAACSPSDYHFEYTECDNTGSRWRVAIPTTPGKCSGLPEPIKGRECSFSCGSGEFLDLFNQTCSKCAAGSYSLGSGIRFDEWENLPPGFSTVATFVEDADSSATDGLNCSSSSWVPQSSYIASNRDDCTVSLIYSVHLKKAGSVSFDYQYVDNSIFFEFFVQNDQCQDTESAEQKWMQLTERDEWRRHSMNLKTGTNVLYWRTTGILLGDKLAKRVLLKDIYIEGVAYTSECFPCKPGTYSDTAGSSLCKPCPRNTFSRRGASSCQKCDEALQFSEEGSSKCQNRPPCTEKDYFQIHTPCDSERKTQMIYKWISPKLCRDNIAKAVKLPPSGEKQPCPPCNPGFYNNDTASCAACPSNTISDGMSACKQCPAGTEPALGFEYKWWNTLPFNMKTSCFNVGNTKCDGMNGWEVGGDHVHSGIGSSDNDYLILSLYIPSFSSPISTLQSAGIELGRVTFVFETQCTGSCELYFMVDINRKSTNVVESWEGTKERQSYTHFVTKNTAVTYTWAFQRATSPYEERKRLNDNVKIYSIVVNNAANGVGLSCRPCALGSDQSSSSCVPCPPGHYIEKDTNQCQECPPETYLSAHHVYGVDSCIPCGPGSRSNKDHSICFSDCSFAHSLENHTLTFEFSGLNGVSSLMNGPSFTSRGTKFFHLFNISLCGNQGAKVAVCSDNVTGVTVQGMQSDPSDFGNEITSFLCQSTIIPSDGRSFRTALSSQSISLGDAFLGASVETSMQNMTARPDLFPPPVTRVPDIHFFYMSSMSTTSCESERGAVISLRCNPARSGRGEISVPSECPGGTCDGCTFLFLWESAEACPLCTMTDYHEIEGACRGGTQETTYVWKEPKVCIKGVSLPEKSLASCEMIDFWLKVVVGVGAFTAVLLIILTCYFWKKNKRLEYKYSKLVMNTNSREVELPAADSCAIMEGEDNEEDVVYSNKPSLLGKLKSLTSKDKEDIFESVQLKSPRSHNI
ncbi:endosome/lysosome-associated apoptosis and autophagy regulator family member 2 [Narcine bancroftii]|uniref:endosome/lysosome-associated apoptosis and autophagy regulator family member 2 n=1 Tax=Narcine bancroftii TaxID=1343680 RepID=UPI00383170C5